MNARLLHIDKHIANVLEKFPNSKEAHALSRMENEKGSGSKDQVTIKQHEYEARARRN